MLAAGPGRIGSLSSATVRARDDAGRWRGQSGNAGSAILASLAGCFLLAGEFRKRRAQLLSLRFCEF